MAESDTFQKWRFSTVMVLMVFVLLVPFLLFVRFIISGSEKDDSDLNDFWAAGLFWLLSVGLPATAFIFANLKINTWRVMAQYQVDRRLAVASFVLLCVGCVYILIGIVTLLFFAEKEIVVPVEGHGGVVRVIRYPVDEAMQIVCVFFGSLVTCALSLDLFSLSLPDKKSRR